QCLPEALQTSARDRTVGRRRVEHGATIGDGSVLEQADVTRLGIDLDDCDVHRCGIGRGALFEAATCREIGGRHVTCEVGIRDTAAGDATNERFTFVQHYVVNG